MALSEKFYVGLSLDQIFFDKDTGLPLANGTITFYRNNSRNELKPVYQLSGTPPDNYTYVSMGATLTLSSIGTVLNSGDDPELIYYYPFEGIPSDDSDVLDLYYIVCRNSDAVEQWTREALPNLVESTNPTNEAAAVSNQISNPQFSRTFLNDTQTVTYSVTAAAQEEFEFAPDWVFVISGTGTVVATIVPLSGSSGQITSAPYYVKVDTDLGISECLLRQRMNNNSGVWSSTTTQNIFVAGTFVARSELAGNPDLQLYYLDQASGTPVLIVDAALNTGSFVEFTGGSASAIPASANPATGYDAYVDLYLSFPSSSSISVTSIQVTPNVSDTAADLRSYEQQSSNREQALMGDYYIPRLEQKPISSLLVGWDFPLNPAQFGGATKTITTTAGYVWDQTIACSLVGNVALTRASATQGAQFVPVSNDEAFYILQYMSGRQARKIVGTRLSANINAYKGSAGSDVVTRFYLYRAPAATVIPTLPTSIGTVAANGVFSLSGGSTWTLVPRGGLDVAQATLNTVASYTDLVEGNDYGFQGYEITDASQIGDTDKFAVVVTFSVPSSGTQIGVDSVSLVPGDIPTRPAPQSQDEVLRECMFFYEKSKNNDSALTDNTGIQGAMFASQLSSSTGGAIGIYATGFGFQFKVPKRISPTVSFHSVTGTASQFTAYLYINNATAGGTPAVISVSDWAQLAIGEKGVQYRPNSGTHFFTVASASTNSTAFILFHYEADARLGII